MVSAIDATKPANGVLANKADLRGNFGAAKTEIEALQAEVVALLSALQLSSGDVDFPIIAGNNFPPARATIIAILQSLDAAIGAGGGVGSVALEDITNISTPSDTIRRNFQKPVEVGAENADFSFDENAQGGTMIPLDNGSGSVRVSFPDANTLAREDGYLCSLTPLSAANVASVAAPTGALRIQNSFFGVTEVQTEVFLGLSQASGIRTVIDIFKDGAIYVVRGPVRITSGEDISFNAPGSVLGTALEALGLPASAFPNLLDLGGTKQAGGSRDILETIGGTHTFVQANAGKTLEHTGAGAVTWTTPALLPGTVVEVENAAGGEITFDIQGGQTPSGGTTLEAGSFGAVKWLNGNRVRLIGTV